MTDTEATLRAELDRRYSPPERDSDWEDVLNRLTERERAVTRGEPGPLSRIRRSLVVVGAITLAATAAVLTLIEPWHSSQSFVDEALAAVGNGRYVQAVLQVPGTSGEFLDLASGNTRPVLLQMQIRYDTSTDRQELWLIQNGTYFAVSQTARSPQIPLSLPLHLATPARSRAEKHASSEKRLSLARKLRSFASSCLTREAP